MLRGGAQAGSASLGTAVAAAFDRNLQERATEIRDAARVLAKTMREQVAEWMASRPNDPETLTRYDDMLAFLERVACELERMAQVGRSNLNQGRSHKGWHSVLLVSRGPWR